LSVQWKLWTLKNLRKKLKSRVFPDQIWLETASQFSAENFSTNTNVLPKNDFFGQNIFFVQKLFYRRPKFGHKFFLCKNYFFGQIIIFLCKNHFFGQFLFVTFLHKKYVLAKKKNHFCTKNFLIKKNQSGKNLVKKCLVEKSLAGSWPKFLVSENCA